MSQANQHLKLVQKTLRHMVAMNEGHQVGGILLAGAPGVGKAQPLTAKIKTPDGWTTMGEIKVGDVITTPSGELASVSGVFPQGKREVYRLTFSDGRTTESCGEHLWKVRLDRTDAWRVISTTDIQRYLTETKRWVYIPTIDPAAGGNETSLPIDPYVLGCLIGDGGFTNSSITFSNADEEVIQEIEQRLESGYVLRHQSNYDYQLVCERWTNRTRGSSKHTYRDFLVESGLNGITSDKKFIPVAYKNASTQQRTLLLAGLIDTDGTVTPNGALSFSTSSSLLADDVCEIVRSLGGHAKITTRKTSYVYEGEKREGLLSYNVSIRYDDPQQLSLLTRKKSRLPEHYQYAGLDLRITSIERVGVNDVQCIMVDHPDHLYITDNYIVTHNTTFVSLLGSLLGLKAIVIEVPHVTEEHLINIPFIVFDPITGNTQSSTTQMNYKMVLAQSNLFTQMTGAGAMSDQQYLDHIKSAPKHVQQIFMSLGGNETTIPPMIKEARERHTAILFLDEYYRQTSTRIRNIMRGILNGNIGMHKIPKSVYIFYASNMRDTGGLEDIPSNHQFNVVEYKAPSAKDWFDWLVSSYEKDMGSKMKVEVVERFKQILLDEHISYTDLNADVRTSPRRWEQILLYVSTSIPCESHEDARALLTNIRNNFINYESGQHSDLADKVVEAVVELIKQTSNLELTKNDKLSDEDWRAALNHAIEQQKRGGEQRRHVPVISGPPGIGKTTECASVAANHNLRLVEVDVSELYAEDVIGMPIPGRKEGDDITVKFSLPKLYHQIMRLIHAKDAAYVKSLKDKHGDSAQQYIDQYNRQRWKYLIFFDEISRVDEKTFNALRKVILEKSFGPAGDDSGEELRLPREAIVVAAMNPEGVGTERLTSHFRDVVDIIPAKASWSKTRKYLMGRDFKNVTAETKEVAMNIIEAFVKKFMTGESSHGREQRPFYLDIGGSTLYISPREYSDMFATLVREINAGISEVMANEKLKDDEVRDIIDTVVGEALEDSLNMIFYKHSVEKEEFMNILKVWVAKLPPSTYGGVLTRKRQIESNMVGVLGKYFDGRPMTEMLDDIEHVNINNTINNAQFIEELKQTLLSKLIDDASVKKYIIEENQDKVVEKKGTLSTDSTNKVSVLTNFITAVLLTLHLHDYANDRIAAIGKALSTGVSEVRKELVGKGKLTSDVADEMITKVAGLRTDIVDVINGLRSSK